MKIVRYAVLWVILMAISLITVPRAIADTTPQPSAIGEPQKVEDAEAKETESQKVEVEAGSQPGNVTMDFRDADIQNVLRILSYKSGINIVAGKDVQGLVTVRLVDVPWEKALDVILRAYDYGYQKDDNIISVAPVDKLAAQRKTAQEMADVEPLVTRIITLKYLDADDASGVLAEQLSPRGKITVLRMTGQKGWEFGTAKAGEGGSGVSGQAREEGTSKSRSKTLVVSDISSSIEKVEKILTQIDKKPMQILIETRLVEVNADKLKDVGLEAGTGTTGVSSTSPTPIPISKPNDENNLQRSTNAMDTGVGGHVLSTQVTPSLFGPETTGLTAANAGMQLLIRKLRGGQFEVLYHALEEIAKANTLSAPRILTLDSQEAKILVGTQFPILESSTESGVVSQTLSYYQDIGIQLKVVPQISDGDYINMIIHPAVSSFTTKVSITGGAEYPIIDVREAETQVLMRSGETLVIGGLLKDAIRRQTIGIPVLGDVPLLGFLFQRRTSDLEKIDLLIFITAQIFDPDDEVPQYAAARPS